MLDLPSLLTDAEVATFAATIALLVGVLQNLSWVPIPEGSRTRAWAVAILAALFVGLAAPGAELSGTNLVLGLVLSYTALSAAALGVNRAGSFAVREANTAIAKASPGGGDSGDGPTLDTRGSAP